MSTLSVSQLLKIGNLYKKNGKTKEAIQIFERCIQQNRLRISSSSDQYANNSSVDQSSSNDYVNIEHNMSIFSHLLQQLDQLEDYRPYYNIAVCYCDIAAHEEIATTSAGAAAPVNNCDDDDDDDAKTVDSINDAGQNNALALQYLEQAASICQQTVVCMEELMEVKANSRMNGRLVDDNSVGSSVTSIVSDQMVALVLRQYSQVGRAKPCWEDILVLLTGLYIKCQLPELCLARCITLLNLYADHSRLKDSPYVIHTESAVYVLPLLRSEMEIESDPGAPDDMSRSQLTIPVECMYNLNIALRQLDAMNCAIAYSWYVHSLLSGRCTNSSCRSQFDTDNIDSAGGSYKPTPPAIPLVIVCVKWGTKYDYVYVNNLYYALLKYLPLVPFKLFCLTEDGEGVHSDVTCINIWTPDAAAAAVVSESEADIIITKETDRDQGQQPSLSSMSSSSLLLQGWWVKAFLFSGRVEVIIRKTLSLMSKNSNYSVNGSTTTITTTATADVDTSIPVVYFDLDIIICNPIDELVQQWIHRLGVSSASASSVLVSNHPISVKENSRKESVGGSKLPLSQSPQPVQPAQPPHSGLTMPPTPTVISKTPSTVSVFLTLNTSSLTSESRSGGFNSSIMVWTLGTLNHLFDYLVSDSVGGDKNLATNCGVSSAHLLSFQPQQQAQFTFVRKVIYKFDHYLEMMLLPLHQSQPVSTIATSAASISLDVVASPLAVDVGFLQDLSETIVDYRSLRAVNSKTSMMKGYHQYSQHQQQKHEQELEKESCIVVFPLYPKPHHLVRECDLLVQEKKVSHYVSSSSSVTTTTTTSPSSTSTNSSSSRSNSDNSSTNTNRHWVCDYWYKCTDNVLIDHE